MATPRTLRLSLSGFLFEDHYATQSLSLEDFCHVAKTCGYAGVELRRTQVDPNLSATQRQTVKQLLEAYDLELTCLTLRTPPSKDFEKDQYLTRYLQLCVDLNCSLLKVSGTSNWLIHATELAKSYDIRLATNNHINTETETIAGTDQCLQSIKHHNFGLLFDPMHLQFADQDTVEPIARWSSRMFNALCQCYRPVKSSDEIIAIQHDGRRWTQARPEEPGTPPWPMIAKAMFHHGYNGWLTVIEHDWPSHQRKQVAENCARYLSNIFANAGYHVRP